MTDDEMTIAEVLKDPLIRQMMRADRVSLREMEKLLREAALGIPLALSEDRRGDMRYLARPAILEPKLPSISSAAPADRQRAWPSSGISPACGRLPLLDESLLG